MSPQPSVLALPKKRPAAAAAPVVEAPPRAAPVEPVQRVAPFASPQPNPAPAKPYVSAPGARARAAVAHKSKRPTPIVHAPPNVHAQRPPAPAAKPGPAGPGKPTLAAAPAAVVEPARPAETKGTVTGLPLPRWAALRADEVNLRVGPGMRFPIEWQYRRRDLPVQILREVEVWRLIEDQDGVKGWVHQATLIGRRSFVVKVPEAVIRGAAAETAAPVARLKQGVVGRIRACEVAAAWCEVQVDDYRGWVRRDQMFGIDPGEAVGN
jgi:SH3-like domain-containing protein